MTGDEEALAARLAVYEALRTNLLPALHDVQETLGYLPGWALERVGKQLHVPASEVYGVATGYTEFRLEPPPAGLLQVCTGLSCRLAGADSLLREVREGGAAVEPIPCIFLCALAPVVARGEQFIGHADAATTTTDRA
jgi:NADH:ubiquinone oxidoreductase subunit E